MGAQKFQVRIQAATHTMATSGGANFLLNRPCVANASENLKDFDVVDYCFVDLSHYAMGKLLTFQGFSVRSGDR